MLKPAIVEIDPTGLRLLTTQELCALIEQTEIRNAVVAEVCRRLIRRPQKANYLTFRWLVPLNDKDQEDAFNGLMACCWKATEKRIFPFGLFPRGYLETRDAIVKETRDAITDALVDYLYGLKGMSAQEIILMALNGGFPTDAKVGNAVRQRVREESKHLAYGDDVVSSDDEGGYKTLLEILPDTPGARTNLYNDAVQIILEEKPHVVVELGEECWQVLEELVELVDNDMLPRSKRDRQRTLTRLFETVYGVNERQARTQKNRFLRAVEAAASGGNSVFESIAGLVAAMGCWD